VWFFEKMRVGEMNQVVIENPILNSPFEEPRRHFTFTEDGITTEDIATWFIRTDYNEETFIVRHAYFTGADQPYEKLQRALRAEIDESAWSALCSTTSYPFDKPKTGKIAVKVINHNGDEVLKVYEVA
jgi:hypothetical protein